jgi:F-type H+-transporting ATPase subunit epsilon
MPLTVQIITPEKALPAQEADHVTIPASEGEAGIRIGHAPYVASLKNGKVFVKSRSKPDAIYIVRGGVAQVFKDQVKILTEGVAEPGQVSEKDLVARLEKLLATSHDDPVELLKAKAEAQWIETQLIAAGKMVPDLSRLN